MRDTLDMARDAGLEEMWEFTTGFTKRLKAFEALVRADERSVERARIIAENELVIERVNEHIDHLNAALLAEREACAKVCEDDALSSQYGERSKYRALLAAAIRERSANERARGQRSDEDSKIGETK